MYFMLETMTGPKKRLWKNILPNGISWKLHLKLKEDLGILTSFCSK